MNKQVTDKCENTAIRIINLIDALGFTVENKSKVYELKILITNEVRHCVSDVAVEFYKNTAIVPIETDDNVVVDDEISPI